MLRIKKLNENHRCKSFACFVKKQKHSIASRQKTKHSSKQHGDLYFDTSSDLGSPSYCGSTTTSSLTTLSGVYTEFCIDDMKATSPAASHSWTHPSITCTTSSYDDIKAKMSGYQKNRDISNVSSPTASSSLSPLSEVNTSCFGGELKVAVPKRQSRQKKPRNLVRLNVQFPKVKNTSDKGRLKSKKETLILEVVSNGTRLMRTIQFPTVIIQMRWKKLDSSLVYYVILKSTGRYVGDIACLLLASPWRTNGVQRAELMPLHTASSRKVSGTCKLAPMLLRERYRCLFEEGCTFKVKAIEYGRRVEWNKKPWKNYDFDKGKTHDLLRRLVYLDVSLMPTHMLKLMSPLRVSENLPENETRRRRKSYFSLLQKKKSRHLRIQKILYLQSEASPRERNNAGGSNFKVRYNTFTPNMRMDNDFLRYMSKEAKGNYNDTLDLKKYIYVSGLI